MPELTDPDSSPLGDPNLETFVRLKPPTLFNVAPDALRKQSCGVKEPSYVHGSVPSLRTTFNRFPDGYPRGIGAYLGS